MNVYLAQGCAFLPASDFHNSGDDWYAGDIFGVLLSSSENGQYDAHNIRFNNELDFEGNDAAEKYIYYYSVRLVKPVE